MGVAVQSNAVRTQDGHFVKGPLYAAELLQWQAVDEVVVDGGIADFAGRLRDKLDLFEGLDAVHHLLYLRIKVLNAKAHATESQFEEGLQMRRRRIVGMSFQAVVGMGNGFGSVENAFDEPMQIRRTEKGRGAAAEVQLLNPGLFGECVQVHLPFLEYRRDVDGFDGVVHRDAGIAAAVCAKAFAVGEVDVKADALVSIADVEGFPHQIEPLRLRWRFFIPIGNGRITRVTRTLGIVFLDE